MKHLFVVFGKHQRTREVLIPGIGCDDLIGVRSIENGLACNRAVLQAHVDVIGPKNRLLPDARFYKGQRIIGKLMLRSVHIELTRTCWTEHLTLGVRRGGQRERSRRWQPSPARACSAERWNPRSVEHTSELQSPKY